LYADNDNKPQIDICIVIKDYIRGDERRTGKHLLSTDADHDGIIGVPAQAVVEALEFANERLKTSASLACHNEMEMSASTVM
jgi:hypothetical protein